MTNNETNIIVLDFYDEFYAPLSIIFEKYIENCKIETMYKNDFKDIMSRYKGKDLKFIYFIYSDHNYIEKYYFRNMTIKDFCRKNKNINIISLNNKFSTIYDASINLHKIATEVNLYNIFESFVFGISDKQKEYLSTFIRKILDPETFEHKLYKNFDIIQNNEQDNFLKMIEKCDEFYLKEWTEFM